MNPFGPATQAYERALAPIGLPLPTSLTPLGSPGEHASCRLSFDEDELPDVVLKEFLDTGGVDHRQHELAALMTLDALQLLPTVSNYQILTPDDLPAPAVVMDLLPGRPGLEWIREDPSLAPQVFAALGRVISVLSEAFQPRFGTHAEGGLFIPRRTSWREEWVSWLAHWVVTARTAGTDLGPLTDAMLDRIDERLPTLELADQWTLVHNGLGPDEVLFTREGDELTLSGVIGWDRAISGDASVEWAEALLAPASLLAPAIPAFGRQAFEEMLDPEVVARLEVYLYSYCIAKQARAGFQRFRYSRAGNRAHLLELARLHAEQVLQPDYVRSRLSEALETSTPPDPDAVPSPRAEHVHLRSALESLRFDPRPGFRNVRTWAGALAGAFIDHPKPMELAKAMVPFLGPQALPVPDQPIRDVGEWREELVGRALERGRERGGCLSLVALSLGLRVIDALDGAVTDGCLRGLELLVQTLLTREGINRAAGIRLGAHEQLLQTIAGLAALQGLGPAPEVEEVLVQQIADAWAMVAPLEPAREGPPLREQLDALFVDVSTTPLGPTLPVVVLALLEVDEARLPASPSAILQVLCAPA